MKIIVFFIVFLQFFLSLSLQYRNALQRPKAFSIRAVSSITNDKRKSQKFVQFFKAQDRKDTSVTIFQQTAASTLHPSLPVVLSLESGDFSQETATSLVELVEQGINAALDLGARCNQITLQHSPTLDVIYGKLGFIKGDHSSYTLDQQRFFSHCVERLSVADAFVINNILGRLSHETGKFEDAILFYTQALQSRPKSDIVFRHIGAAYHEKGDLQLAFASYQQALELNPNSVPVYLKLAYLYESLSKKEWKGADDNARKCYEFYLESVGQTDIAALTRFGNFLVNEHEDEAAIEAYEKALAIDPDVTSVWLNKAVAEVKIKRFDQGISSLKRVLQLDPSQVTAQHMLMALDEKSAKEATGVSSSYVRELFDSYAPSYEDHGRRLQYSAPRIIRQELARLYDVEEAPETVLEQNTCSEAEHSFHDCGAHDKQYNISLDILDLGCGTGLAGSWLKDFARDLVGVDVSLPMLDVARGKKIYSTLWQEPIDKFLSRRDLGFDVVVASDVLSYIGDLGQFSTEVIS